MNLDQTQLTHVATIHTWYIVSTHLEAAATVAIILGLLPVAEIPSFKPLPCDHLNCMNTLSCENHITFRTDDNVIYLESSVFIGSLGC